MAEIQQKDSGGTQERETEEIQYPGGFYAYGGYEYVVDYFLHALHVHE